MLRSFNSRIYDSDVYRSFCPTLSLSPSLSSLSLSPYIYCSIADICNYCGMLYNIRIVLLGLELNLQGVHAHVRGLKHWL